MDLIEKYELDIKSNGFIKDPYQIKAIHYLQCISNELDSGEPLIERKKPFWSLFSFSKNNPPKMIKGFYSHGGVGRGKTYLMDLFFDNLKTKRKSRMHFHHFMLEVHKEMNLLSGQKNPLLLIADKFAKQTDIICFDEFFVSDITDAMILAGIFKALFNRGVILVATSNIHPDDLYKNGLQRQRFLPAIELVKSHCHVFNLDGGKDYRIDRISEIEIYHFPLDERATSQLKDGFLRLAKGHVEYQKEIEINHRQIQTRSTTSNVLSIEFLALCDSPRSVNDYIEIAILYRIVFIAHIKHMDDLQNDVARRFIAMVDEFYDKHVVLIMSAEVCIEALYTGERLSFEFQRCVSRLLEMQSADYLSKSHCFEEE